MKIGNIFESIKQLDKVKVSKFLPDEKLIEEAEQMMDCKFGKLLYSYLEECGAVMFFFVEMYGINKNQGLQSDMVVKTKMLHDLYPQTKNFVAIEDMGDGDYILCDKNDNISEFIPSLSADLKSLEINLIDHIQARYIQVSSLNG